jgi:hypothetical protein
VVRAVPCEEGDVRVSEGNLQVVMGDEVLRDAENSQCSVVE